MGLTLPPGSVPGGRRGGSVCLHSFGAFSKWISAGNPVDGYHLDLVAAKESQRLRVESRTDEPFAALARLLPEKSNLDAWHLHTAHVHKAFCFLTMDFRLKNAVSTISRNNSFPALDTKLMLPSDLAAAIGLRPIDTFLISYRKAIWAVHPEMNLPGSRRQPSPSRNCVNDQTGVQRKMEESTGINQLPGVKRMRGAQITHSMEAVNIQYDDEHDRIHELTMRLDDALYLLSIRKLLVRTV
jgi:hypothetical protein